MTNKTLKEKKKKKEGKNEKWLEDLQLSRRTRLSSNCYFSFITITCSHSNKDTWSGKSIHIEAWDWLETRSLQSVVLELPFSVL